MRLCAYSTAVVRVRWLTGRIEQPGEIVALAWPGADRIGGEQGLVLGAADGDEAFERRRRVRADLAIKSARGEADASAGVFQDISELAAVQLGVRRHRCQSRVPNAEHQFEIVRRIFRDDGDALAGLKPEALPQRSREPSHASGALGIAPDHARARAEGRPIPVANSRAFEPKRQVHRTLPATGTPVGVAFNTHLSGHHRTGPLGPPRETVHRPAWPCCAPRTSARGQAGEARIVRSPSGRARRRRPLPCRHA